MSKDNNVLAFPDVGTKLIAPTKKSLFEKQKAEAEAKRQKEQLETAAVYEDFVKSFTGDDDGNPNSTPLNFRASSGPSGAAGPPGFSKRHFTGPSGPSGPSGPPGRAFKSGPGSLGPTNVSRPRKRPFDDGPSSNRDSKYGMFAFEDATGNTETKAAFPTSDDEDEKTAGRNQERAIPKPTLHLSSIPPGTSPAAIKAVLPSNLIVDAVRIVPVTATGAAERRSVSAIVTLAKDTPAVDLDTAVNALQNKYLGYGYYLSLSRHLSSAVIGSSLPGSSSSSLPFGAKPTQHGAGRGFSRMQPPGPHRGGFAPPSSFGPPGSLGRGAPSVQVTVAPPSDLRKLKLIHKTLEALINHGPEFEALLMSRPDVQKDEKWAWIWNSSSAGGVWYRWRLWDILTKAGNRRASGRNLYDEPVQKVFSSGAPWMAQESTLPFEYTTALDEFVSDSDYNSSEDEDSGDEGRRRLHHLQGGAMPPDALQSGADDDGPAYLNPLRKAKFLHLLSRVPETTAKLRRGDVARITAFAIAHAGEGADEVVELLVANVHRPFALLSSSNSKTLPANEDDSGLENNDTSTEERKQQQQANANADSDPDPSPLKLIALYLISDILSSSSTSGVRHAWRYRQLFESTLKRKATFEHLGRLDKQLKWGRLRAEKWRRAVGSVLSLWEGWCVFSAAAQEAFVGAFANPPLTKAEQEEAARGEEEARTKAERGKGRWKTVSHEAGGGDAEGDEMDVDSTTRVGVEDTTMGRTMLGEGRDGEDDMDGYREEDLDGEPMEEEDLDGEPMDEDEDEDDNEGKKKDQAETTTSQLHPTNITSSSPPNPPAPVPHSNKDDDNDTGEGEEGRGNSRHRRRPKAEDMFADSDGDGDVNV